MKTLDIPFDLSKARKLADEFGTPLYVYDESGIRLQAKEIRQAFSWAKNYRNYFAVKACPTPAILKILNEEGMGFDCSSRSELVIVQRLGIEPGKVFYTSNNTPKEDFELAITMGVVINIDDLTQVDVFCDLIKASGYHKVACRYNPGDQKTGNSIIGKPSESKYGMSLEQLVIAYKKLRLAGVEEFGLHTMVASNELNPAYFADTAKLLVDALKKIEDEAEVGIEFVNLGGGFGLNYRPDQSEFDINKCSRLIKKEFSSLTGKVRISTENGRYITGPHGYLLTRVRYVMSKYKKYIGVDASMHNLMRPGMYGSYHHITVLGKNDHSDTQVYDVVGSLCENNDKFAVDRLLPVVEPEDLIVIHDVGAHGHAMGFNYNGLLRCAEVLLSENGETKLIRKAETVDQYLQNVVW